jgi:hypothetical protein
MVAFELQGNNDELTVEKIDEMIKECSKTMKLLNLTKRRFIRNERNRELLKIIEPERSAYEDKKRANGRVFKISDPDNRDQYWIRRAKAKLAEQKIEELERKYANVKGELTNES